MVKRQLLNPVTASVQEFSSVIDLQPDRKCTNELHFFNFITIIPMIYYLVDFIQLLDVCCSIVLEYTGEDNSASAVLQNENTVFQLPPNWAARCGLSSTSSSFINLVQSFGVSLNTALPCDQPLPIDSAVFLQLQDAMSFSWDVGKETSCFNDQQAIHNETCNMVHNIEEEICLNGNYM